MSSISITSSKTSSYKGNKFHQKREIKIKHVDSVKYFLEPVLRKLPQELMELGEQFQKMSNSLYQQQVKEEQMKEEKNNEYQVEKNDYIDTMPIFEEDKRFKNSYYDSDNLFFNDLKEDENIFRTYDDEERYMFNLNQIFKNDFNKDDEISNNNDNIFFSYDPNNNNEKSSLPVIDEETVDLAKKILEKIKQLSEKMQKNRISTNDLFKHQNNKTYLIFDEKKKKFICDMVQEFGAKVVATSLNLSIKSLKRWLKSGIERKKGGGRKILDPEMENKVVQWFYKQKSLGRKVTAKNIKVQARRYSTCKNFLASKGWFEKFRKKYNIKPDTHLKKCEKYDFDSD